MGRASLVFTIRKHAYDAVKHGKTQGDGWTAFVHKGISWMEGHLSRETIKEVFNEAYAQATEQEKKKGQLPFLVDTKFSKKAQAQTS